MVLFDTSAGKSYLSGKMAEKLGHETYPEYRSFASLFGTILTETFIYG